MKIGKNLALWLSLIGLLIQLIVAVGMSSLSILYHNQNYPWYMGGLFGGFSSFQAMIANFWAGMFGYMGGLWFWISLMLFGVGFVGLTLLASNKRIENTIGAIILIIASALSFTTLWGLGVGSFLVILGAGMRVNLTRRDSKSELGESDNAVRE